MFANEMNTDYQIDDMTPLSFRFLHLLFHSFLFMLMKANFIQPKDLLDLIMKKHKKSTKTAEEYLQEHIESDWKVLKELISDPDYDIFINAVFALLPRYISK